MLIPPLNLNYNVILTITVLVLPILYPHLTTVSSRPDSEQNTRHGTPRGGNVMDLSKQINNQTLHPWRVKSEYMEEDVSRLREGFNYKLLICYLMDLSIDNLSSFSLWRTM